MFIPVQQRQAYNPKLDQSWASVADGEPTPKQRVNVPCLVGKYPANKGGQQRFTLRPSSHHHPDLSQFYQLKILKAIFVPKPCLKPNWSLYNKPAPKQHYINAQCCQVRKYTYLVIFSNNVIDIIDCSEKVLELKFINSKTARLRNGIPKNNLILLYFMDFCSADFRHCSVRQYCNIGVIENM